MKILNAIRRLCYGKTAFTKRQYNNYGSRYPVQFENFLDTQTNMNCSQLTTGLVVANEERESCHSCIGIFIDAGSRHEMAQENGIAHFFEHICFKGTQKRAKNNLECEISELGAKFKCFTGREQIGFLAECLNHDIPHVVDILTDCIFNNAYCDADIEIQKNVVYQEMMHYDQDTYCVIMDYLHSGGYQGTALAQSVMGPSYNLYNFCAASICAYVNKYFVPSRIVFAGAGAVKHDQLLSLASTYINKFDAPRCPSYSPYRFTAADTRYRDDSLEVAHIALALEAPPFNHPHRLPLELAAACIGSWDRSQNGGDNHSVYAARAAASGLANSYESFYIPYTDTGLWGIHYVSDPLTVDDMMNVIAQEWMHLCNCITDAELLTAKLQLKNDIILKNQSAAETCKDIAKHVHFMGRAVSMQEKFKAIDYIGCNELREACTTYIYDKCPVVAAYGAVEQLHSYSRLRPSTYWLRV